MAKRIVAGILCGIMLLSLLLMAVRAEKMTEAEQIKKEAADIYQKCLESTGKESLRGFCGMMSSHQLHYMGVNKYLVIQDGNKQFDYYRDMDVTNGGYYPRAISAEEGDMVYALNAISRYGTRNVYNILVGFQWTDTEAGGTFGHACVIHAIVDGMVYYVESFYTPYAGEEGNVGCCTIEEFASQFASWTVYEGIIHFGSDYAEGCKNYGTDLFVRTRFAATLRTQPCTPGDYGCKVARTVAACEVLHVTGVYENREGEFFYQVMEGGKVYYIYANATSLLAANGQDVQAEDLQIPRGIRTGQNADFVGIVKANRGLVGNLQIRITDTQEQVVLDKRQIVDSIACDLQALNQQVDTSTLNPGNYIAEVVGYTASACVAEGELSYAYAPRVLYSAMFTVGEQVRAAARMTDAMEVQLPEDGWFVQNGEIYRYQDGKPVTGWYKEFGVEYYFTESGAAAQGELILEGTSCQFSNTGKLIRRIGIIDRNETAVK